MVVLRPRSRRTLALQSSDIQAICKTIVSLSMVLGSVFVAVNLVAAGFNGTAACTIIAILWGGEKVALRWVERSFSIAAEVALDQHPEETHIDAETR